MNMANHNSRWLICAVLLALMGCAGHVRPLEDGNAGLSPGAGEHQSGIPDMPGVQARAPQLAPARQTSTTLLLERTGSQYVRKSDNATTDDAAGTLQLGPTPGELSWGLYGFGGLGQTDVPHTLTIELGPPVPQVLWVALADYAARRWYWQRGEPAGGRVRLELPNGRRYVNAVGSCFVAVAVWDGQQATLSSLQLTYEHGEPSPLGVWPMSGYDAQHSGRSPYTGPEEPELKWSLKIGGIYQGLAISNDGVIYSGSSDDKLTAVSLQGVVLWEFTVPDSIFFNPAISLDGTVFFPCKDYYFYAVNPDGTLRWKYDMGYFIHSAPVIGTDGRVYICGPDGLHCFEPGGDLVWISAAGPYVDHTPAIAADGTIYVTSAYSGLCAIDPDGAIKWWCADVSVLTSAVSIGPDGTIYAASNTPPPPDAQGEFWTHMYAVSPAGVLQWTLNMTFDQGVPSFAADGTLYLLQGSALYALNSDGTTQWTHTGGEAGSQSVAVDAQGTVYFGTRGSGNSAGNVVALNPDGALKWSWSAPGPVPYGPLVIGRDNMLYVGDHDGRLLALGQQ